MFTFIFLFLSLMFFLSLGLLAKFFSSFNPFSFKILLKDLNRKMSMTLSLGILFFCVYFLAVHFSKYLVQEWKLDIFVLIYENPILFIYGGLWVFACSSLSIYLVRLFIKYFYLTRGKDN